MRPPRHNWNGSREWLERWRHLTKRHFRRTRMWCAALFPDIVSAVAEGRVVAEVAAR